MSVFKYAILLILLSSQAYASTYLKTDEARSPSNILMGWTFTFSLKTSPKADATPTTTFIRNCDVYIGPDFKKANAKILDYETHRVCAFDETEAKQMAQQTVDEDEAARTKRGEDSTEIERKRLAKHP